MFTGSRAKAAWLALALVCAVFAWMTWPLRLVGSANSRLLIVFYVDEFTHFNVLSSSLTAHAIPFGMGYGYPLFNAARLALLPIASPSEQQIVLALRTVEWVCAIATLVAVFVTLRRLSIVAAVVTTTLLSLLPIFVRWSVISHPDVMQLLFLWLALYACAQRLDGGSRRWTLLAAAWAGAAFGAKFAGMFVLPIILGTDLLADTQPDYSRGAVLFTRVVTAAGAIAAIAAAAVLSPAFVASHLTVDGSIELAKTTQLIQLGRIGLAAAGVAGLALAASRRLAMLFVPALLVFGVVFTVTSPQAWRGLHFIRELVREASTSGVDQQGANFGVLLAPDMLTWGMAVFAAAGLVAVVVKAARTRAASLEIVHAIWVVLFGAALAASLRSHDQPSYYLLPILPSLLFLAVRVWESALQFVRRQTPVLASLGVVVLIALVCGEVTYDAMRTAGLRREVLNAERDSRPVQLGGRLACYLQPDAKILFDYLSYVPPAFAGAQPTWGGSLALVREQRPDAIIVNTSIEGLYRAPGDGGDRDSSRYYASLRENATDFRLAADDGPVRLYVRPGSPHVITARGCS